MNKAVVFDKVNIVFGEKPEAALPMMDEGKSRADIQSATGQVLGVHDCSLEVCRARASRRSCVRSTGSIRCAAAMFSSMTGAA